MTGPEHYREAEQHLDFARGEISDAVWHQGQAQIHATLALAAAVWDTRTVAGRLGVDWDAATARAVDG